MLELNTQSQAALTDRDRVISEKDAIIDQLAQEMSQLRVEIKRLTTEGQAMEKALAESKAEAERIGSKFAAAAAAYHFVGENDFIVAGMCCPACAQCVMKSLPASVCRMHA